MQFVADRVFTLLAASDPVSLSYETIWDAFFDASIVLIGEFKAVIDVTKGSLVYERFMLHKTIYMFLESYVREMVQNDWVSLIEIVVVVVVEPPSKRHKK